jgi:hypothetical protein
VQPVLRDNARKDNGRKDNALLDNRLNISAR